MASNSKLKTCLNKFQTNLSHGQNKCPQQLAQQATEKQKTNQAAMPTISASQACPIYKGTGFPWRSDERDVHMNTPMSSSGLKANIRIYSKADQYHLSSTRHHQVQSSSPKLSCNQKLLAFSNRQCTSINSSYSTSEWQLTSLVNSRCTGQKLLYRPQ